MLKNIVELDMGGNIKIPVELRNKMKIAEGTTLEIHEEGKGLTLKKLNDRCILCGSTENLVEKIGRYVCKDCVADLKHRL